MRKNLIDLELYVLEVETHFYNSINKTNISISDMKKMKEEDRLKKINEENKIKQIILEKINKWEVLTPEEYETKKRWDCKIENENESKSNHYLSKPIKYFKTTSPFDPLLMAAWVVALWSLID